MPKLLFVTVPTDEVLNEEGKARFPGTEAAVEKLTEGGWEDEAFRTMAPSVGVLRNIGELPAPG
jgi:hypothetical protein